MTSVPEQRCKTRHQDLSVRAIFPWHLSMINLVQLSPVKINITLRLSIYSLQFFLLNKSNQNFKFTYSVQLSFNVCPGKIACEFLRLQ